MITVFLIIILVILTVLYIDKRKRNVPGINKIPGPPPKVLIGNVFDVGSNTVDILSNFDKLIRQNGTIVKLWLGWNLYVLLSEPRYIGQILAGTDVVKSKMYKYMKTYIGNGLVTSEGKKWKTDRRLLAPYFSSKAVAQFIPIFNKNVNTLVRTLENLAKLGPVDIKNSINPCTFSIICHAAMNVNISVNRSYTDALNWFLDYVINKSLSPLKQIDWLYKLTEDYKHEKANLEILNSCTRSIIERRKKERLTETKEVKQISFLDALIETAEQNDSFTDSDIHDQVQTFIVAGYETVATVVSFGLFELAKHPDVQETILEETNLVLGTDRLADLTIDNVADLKYTECVIKEIMRLYPPVPILERELINDVHFDEHVLPAGTTIIIFMKGAHSNASYFRDPEKFIPERFYPQEAESMPQYGYIPFGGGARICAGQKFALAEAKLLLAKILRNFELYEVQPEHQPILTLTGVLQSSNGLPINLRNR